MTNSSTQDSSLTQLLRRETSAEVLFDDFSRGLYSTDASIYQIKPLGVVVPKTEQDVLATLGIANDAGVSVTMRGGGTSQCGQTVGEGIIVDVSKHLNRLISVDPETRRAVVQPGIVLDQLNALLKPHGLFFPVDVSTSSRATIGGMTANNSCGARSIRYGKMVDNVRAVDRSEEHTSELQSQAYLVCRLLLEKKKRKRRRTRIYRFRYWVHLSLYDR